MVALHAWSRQWTAELGSWQSPSIRKIGLALAFWQICLSWTSHRSGPFGWHTAHSCHEPSMAWSPAEIDTSAGWLPTGSWSGFMPIKAWRTRLAPWSACTPSQGTSSANTTFSSEAGLREIRARSALLRYTNASSGSHIRSRGRRVKSQGRDSGCRWPGGRSWLAFGGSRWLEWCERIRVDGYLLWTRSQPGLLPWSAASLSQHKHIPSLIRPSTATT